MTEISREEQLQKMARDWDERARENARHYVATGKHEWTDEEFFASGESAVREQILNDMINICQGRDPKQMRVIEIGCGAGRTVGHRSEGLQGVQHDRLEQHGRSGHQRPPYHHVRVRRR